jgi:hypothetical protein
LVFFIDPEHNKRSIVSILKSRVMQKSVQLAENKGGLFYKKSGEDATDVGKLGKLSTPQANITTIEFNYNYTEDRNGEFANSGAVGKKLTQCAGKLGVRLSRSRRKKNLTARRSFITQLRIWAAIQVRLRRITRLS